MTTTPTSGAADLPDAMHMAELLENPINVVCQKTAAAVLRHQHSEFERLHALAAGQATAAQAVAEPADTVVLNAAMRAIQQAIELIGAPTDERMRAVRRVLRGAVIVAEDDGKVAPLPGTAYAALPESFLEIPDVQDESGINAYYSREVVLECIDAALASHGQAPAWATLPDGWVPLMLRHEGQYPEEVAYGPPIMMDRLGRWLGKYFDQAAQAASVQEDAARLDEARRLFDAGWNAAALFCDREDVVADGIIGFGASPQFEAAFSAAHGSKGGQHGTE